MEKLRVIFGREGLEEVGDQAIPLEIDSVILPSGIVQPVYLMIYQEEVVIDEIDYLPELIDLHKNLVYYFRCRQWWECLDLVPILHGRWAGMADSFYLSLVDRIKIYSETPPPDTWAGEYWEPNNTEAIT